MKKVIYRKILSYDIARRNFFFVIIAVLTLFAAVSVEAAVIYVDSGAGGANNGSSWTDAYTDLQDALGAAVSGDEIWVAAGTYKSTTGADRTISFVLVDGVGLYGGFAGGEKARDQRDWETNITTLSGDIGTENNDGDNSYHVVECFWGTVVMVLDGITISGGNADGVSPDHRGGAVYTRNNSNLEMTNCNFSDNSASYGGGIYNFGSTTMSNCTFNGNSAGSYGGGIYNSGSITMSNCTFTENSSEYDGGAMYNIESLELTDCTFSGNSTYLSGGGMFFESGSATLTSCTFSENFAGYGGGIHIMGSPTLTKCTFSGNSAESEGGGIYNYFGSPKVTNCTFSGNSANIGGGMLNDDSSPTVFNCTFTQNSSEYDGGGMHTKANSSPTLTNCTFSGNSAGDYGGGIDNWGILIVTNCTFSGNSANYDGDGLNNVGSAVLTIKNTILADNGARDLYNTATINSSYNVVQTYTGFTPDATDITGYQLSLNIGPLADNGGDTLTHALMPGSVAIDAGTSSGAPATDQRGVSRDASPDIGAYEYEVVIFVEPSGFCGGLPPCFTAIQDAVNDADDKTPIRIGAGDYPENIVIEKNVTLEFTWDADFTTLNQSNPAILTGP